MSAAVALAAWLLLQLLLLLLKLLLRCNAVALLAFFWWLPARRSKGTRDFAHQASKQPHVITHAHKPLMIMFPSCGASEAACTTIGRIMQSAHMQAPLGPHHCLGAPSAPPWKTKTYAAGAKSGHVQHQPMIVQCLNMPVLHAATLSGARVGQEECMAGKEGLRRG